MHGRGVPALRGHGNAPVSRSSHWPTCSPTSTTPRWRPSSRHLRRCSTSPSRRRTPLGPTAERRRRSATRRRRSWSSSATGRDRELRGIGPGISARLRELAKSGTIAELDELRSRARPELVGLGRLLGVSPKRMLEIAAALDVETPEDFRRVARAGALQRVPGIGPATEQRILARIEAEPDRPQKGLTLPTARDLVGGIADALGGEIAGDPRRWARPLVRPLGRRPGDRPGRRPRRVRAPAADRDGRRASGAPRTRRDRRGRARRAVPPRARRASAPSSSGRRERPRTSRRSARSPRRQDEEAVYAALGVPWCPPELREEPFRGAPPRLVELARRPRRPPLPHDLVGRQGVGARDGARGARRSATSTSRSATTRRTSASSRGSTPTPSPPGRGDRRARTSSSRRSASSAAPRSTSCRDGALDLPDDVLAELDWVQLSLHAGQREAADDADAAR